MGSGTEADVLKAKQALDLLVGQLEGLEAARIESNRIHEAESRQARQAAHAKLVDDAERLLAEREATIARIEAKARDLREEMGKFDALTADIGSAVTTYRPHVLGRGSPLDHVTTTRMANLSRAAVWNASLPLMVAAMVRGDNVALSGATLADTEAGSARDVRSQIQQVASKRELA